MAGYAYVIQAIGKLTQLFTTSRWFNCASIVPARTTTNDGGPQATLVQARCGA